MVGVPKRSVTVALAVVLVAAATVTYYAYEDRQASGNAEIVFDSAHFATRIPAGRVGPIDNTVERTFQASFEVVDQFKAVRIIFGSDDPAASIVVSRAAVSTPSSAEDVNNSDGRWSTVTGAGEESFAVPIAQESKGQFALALSDWVPLSSSHRSDGGTYPLVTVRARMSTRHNLPALGNGRDDFTNWATRTDARKFWWRSQGGDHLSVKTTFNSKENESQSPIFGVQYLADGQVLSVAAVGDSITEGRGTYKGEGFVFPAVEVLNRSGGPVKYEYANFGWSGQNPSRYSRRTIGILESEISPDIIVLPVGSPNPASAGLLTPGAIDSICQDFLEMLRSARRNSVIPVAWTWLPTNSTIREYGGSDSLRVEYNSERVEEARAGHLLIADTAQPISGETVDGQIQMAAASTNDGIHPNDSGNHAMELLVRPLLVAAGKLSNSR